LQTKLASDIAPLLKALDVPRGAPAGTAAWPPDAGWIAHAPARSASRYFRGHTAFGEATPTGYELCKPWRDSTIILSQRRAGVCEGR
jgi:hypothetical protein